jgi:hypothetical protein
MIEWITANQPCLTFLKDLITIASLTTGALVAIMGLHTWRRQLRGTANYELAKRLLKATYQVRDALQSVRSPLITAGEFAHAVKEAQLAIKPGDENYHADSSAAVYQLRWKPVIEAYQALELEAVEAETLWGSKARAATNTIRKSINSLSSALDLYLRDMQPQGARILDNASRETFRRIVYSVSQNPDEDPFLRDLTAAIASIEAFAKPYLTR